MRCKKCNRAFSLEELEKINKCSCGCTNFTTGYMIDPKAIKFYENLKNKKGKVWNGKRV